MSLIDDSIRTLKLAALAAAATLTLNTGCALNGYIIIDETSQNKESAWITEVDYWPTTEKYEPACGTKAMEDFDQEHFSNDKYKEYSCFPVKWAKLLGFDESLSWYEYTNNVYTACQERLGSSPPYRQRCYNVGNLEAITSE